MRKEKKDKKLIASDAVNGLWRMVNATGLLLNVPTIPTLVMYPILTWMYVREAEKEEKELKV